jgi:hypothetical protein
MNRMWLATKRNRDEADLIVADNTTTRRREYAPLFDFLDDPANGFTTMTVPFSQGLEVAVRTSPAPGHDRPGAQT